MQVETGGGDLVEPVGIKANFGTQQLGQKGASTSQQRRPGRLSCPRKQGIACREEVQANGSWAERGFDTPVGEVNGREESKQI